MEYAVLLYGDETQWESATKEEMAAIMEAHGRFSEAVRAGGGHEVGGVELLSSGSARSLRWNGGVADAVDGPYAEAVEQLGGLYLLEAPDLDRVLEWCRLLPHTAEIRPTVSTGDQEGDDGATEATDPPPGLLQAVALLYDDEERWAQASEEDRAAMYATHGRFAEAVAEAGGAVLDGRELAGSGNATTWRPNPDGSWALTDGPFAETAEQLGGYYHLAAPDMPTLERLLHGLPGGITEIRPVAVR